MNKPLNPATQLPFKEITASHNEKMPVREARTGMIDIAAILKDLPGFKSSG
jgi:hypothetical protein